VIGGHWGTVARAVSTAFEMFDSLTMIALAFPMAHTLTFLSSPPVTMTEPDLRPICKQLTSAPCATKSSARRKMRGQGDSV
jgi:hypothetical protein